MRIGSVDFPYPLLEALVKDELVVFAGAGISQGPPSNYPDFTQLVKMIASGGQLAQKPKEPHDRFLGRLKERGINVHRKAQDVFRGIDSSPTCLHKDLLKLFRSTSRVRVVTTNFDTHLTSAVREQFGELPPVYRAPALPLGHRFNGIVYLHGCLDQSPEELILTDGDFGRSYLTEGWARRFLLDMFSTYTVLFIGYSHDDTVVTYLARGLPQAKNIKRYALVPKGKEKEWEYRGVKPLSFPLGRGANAFKAQNVSIERLAEYVNRDVLDHERRIRDIVRQDHPPMDREEEDDIKKSLQEPATAQFFVRHAKSPTWLRWLDQKGFLIVYLLAKPHWEWLKNSSLNGLQKWHANIPW